MLASEQLSIRDYPPPPRPESPIQQIQGWYYLVGGLWVAVWISAFQSPTDPWIDLRHVWLARGLGFVVAIVGLALIRASRRENASTLTIGLPIMLALVLALLEVGAIANEALPATFLLDVGMELGFLVWWSLALTIQVSRGRRKSIIGES